MCFYSEFQRVLESSGYREQIASIIIATPKYGDHTKADGIIVLPKSGAIEQH